MIPQFNNRKELHEWLRENKGLLLQAKKSAVKQADPVNCVTTGPDARDTAVSKELGAQPATPSNGLLYVGRTYPRPVEEKPIRDKDHLSPAGASDGLR
jgi:hypothetical protein